MSGIFEIEHRPELGVGIGFRDLVERRVVLIDDLVDGTHDARVLDRPPKITTGLTSDDITLDLLFRDGRDGGRRVAVGIPVRWEELGDAQIALRRGCEEVVDAILSAGQTRHDREA